MPTHHPRRRIGKIVALVTGGIVVSAVAAGALISGAQLGRSYLDPWKKSYAGQSSDPRLQVASAGLLAGSSHNTQPWRIDLDDNDPLTFDLYANPERLTPVVDPLGRQAMISQGTFLGYMQEYGAAHGWDVQVKLFPEGELDEAAFSESLANTPIARIRLVEAVPVESSLAEGLYIPDTNRSPYKETPIDPSVASAIENLSNSVARIRLIDNPDEVAHLQAIALSAAMIEADKQEAMDEASALLRSNEYSKNHYRWGFTASDQNANPLVRHAMQTLVTLLPGLGQSEAAAKMFRESAVKHVEGTSAFVLVTTQNNDRHSQVEAGMTYARVVLSANVHGLATHPLSQALQEYPELSECYREIHESFGGDGAIHMLARIGTPTAQVGPSMRMLVDDIVM